jgi:hypothetical protein
VVRQGDGFVVVGVVAQAAIQDVDESVAQRPGGSVVGRFLIGSPVWDRSGDGGRLPAGRMSSTTSRRSHPRASPSAVWWHKVPGRTQPVPVSGMSVILMLVVSAAASTAGGRCDHLAGSRGNRRSPCYLFDCRTRAEGSVMFRHRIHGGDARETASPSGGPGHPAAFARAEETPQPRPAVNEARPVRWIGRCLDR